MIPAHYRTHKTEDMTFHTMVNGTYDFTQPGPPSITIFVSPPGSKFIGNDGKETKSGLGHVAIGVRGFNPITGKYESVSIGLSTGDSMATKNDNLSFNDHARYPEASTLDITSDSPRFHNDQAKLFSVINDYKTGVLQPPTYFLGFKDCIRFVEKDILDRAGVKDIHLSGLTPKDILEMLKHAADDYKTPLVIDLNGDGIHTLSDDHGISFDFNGNGQKSKTGWISKEDGFLVLDKNHDGIINSGQELFGDSSLLDNGVFPKDGFESIGYYDTNKDGVIDKNDTVWKELMVWQDKNSDGVSQDNELLSLDWLGIQSIKLNADEINETDENLNIHKLVSSVQWANGGESDIVDILLHQKATVIPDANNSYVTSEGTDIVPQETMPCEIIGQYQAVPDMLFA